MAVGAVTMNRAQLRVLTQPFQISEGITNTIKGIECLQSGGFHLNDVVATRQGRMDPDARIRPLRHRSLTDGISIGRQVLVTSPYDLVDLLGQRSNSVSPWEPAFELLDEMRTQGAHPGAYGLSRLLVEANEMSHNTPRFRGNHKAYQAYRSSTIQSLLHHERLEWEQRFWAYQTLTGRANPSDDFDNYLNTVTPIVAGPRERILFAMNLQQTSVSLFEKLAPHTHFLLREIQGLLFDMRNKQWVRHLGNDQWTLTEEGRDVRKQFHNTITAYLEAFIHDTIDPDLPDSGYMLDHPEIYWQGMGTDIEELIARFKKIGLADESHQVRWHEAATIHRLQRLGLLPFPSYTLDRLCEAGVITTSEADLIQKYSDSVRDTMAHNLLAQRLKRIIKPTHMHLDPRWKWDNNVWIFTEAKKPSELHSKKTETPSRSRRRRTASAKFF